MNGILFILNAVGKSEKSFPNEKEKLFLAQSVWYCKAVGNQGRENESFSLFVFPRKKQGWQRLFLAGCPVGLPFLI